MKLCKSNTLIIITGPTAVGKTAVGIEIAKKVGGEIISVDSRQVYRHMDIGTAKPTSEEQDAVRHHLIDIREPDKPYSAGQFGQDARRIIRELVDNNTAAILVGGSGLYLEAVVDGFFADDIEHSQLRVLLKERLAQEGLAPLYEELGHLDPLAHSRLASGDAQRILRALELAHDGGGGLLERWQHTALDPLACMPLVFCLSMDRDRLYQRIDQRVDRMVEQGLVEEVRQLVAMGYGRNTPAMGTMGYQEIMAYLAGEYSLESAVDLVKRRSRQYAKRQVTWFRRDRRLRWLNLGIWGAEGVFERILAQFVARGRE